MHVKRHQILLASSIVAGLSLAGGWQWWSAPREYRGTLLRNGALTFGLNFGNAVLDMPTGRRWLIIPDQVASLDTLDQLDGRTVVVTGKVLVRREYDMRNADVTVIYVDNLRIDGTAPASPVRVAALAQR